MNTIPQTVLSEFKGNIRNLNNVLASLIKVWDDPAYIMLNVLLQNLGADSNMCANYDLQEELIQCENIVAAITNLEIYSDIHLISWIDKEVNCLYTGHILMYDHNQQ